MVENGKEPLKQARKEHKPPGKKQMWALWIAIATALGSQGIPKIVELLENKPSVEQVQTMIAKQTEVLTRAQRASVDAFKDLDERLDALATACGEHRTITGKLEGRTELLKEVLRGCCTRSRARERLERPEESPRPADRVPTASPEKSPPVSEEHILEMILKKPGEKRAADKVKKVPEFNMQQQLQIQEPLEE